MTPPAHTAGTPKSSTQEPLSADWQQAIELFVEFQRVHRGIARSTISNHQRVLQAFARHVSSTGVPVRLDQLHARHIDGFLVEQAAPRGRPYVRQVVDSLRIFLRYLALLGHVRTEMASQIMAPRSYRLAELPRALGQDQLRRILDATPRRDACGRRDYAVLMLLASYGLRSGDTRALRLDDLHWRDGTICIQMEKTGRSLVLPITDHVGDALADYIQRGRPRSDYREVFLSSASGRPLSEKMIYSIVRRALARAGVDLRGVAAHAFRHGFASHLVRRGVALRTVASCLGHASSETLSANIGETVAPWKQGTGCRYRIAQPVLRDLDRFLAARDERGPITYDLLARWCASRADLSAGNRELRWRVTRQFCLYLRRYVPETYLPDPLLGRVRRTPYKARIVEPCEMKMLLDALDEVIPGTRFPLRRQTHRTLYTLLYTTGLRISEALHLQVRDVDLLERVITVRETKFWKSRLVPFSDGLLPILRDYHRERLRLFGEPAPDAPFFANRRGRPYSRIAIRDVWLPLLRRTGLGGTGRGSGPRIHDLRHSFATLRLAAWYREGADVRAKLPLLSTYLGHATVAATQRYLTILPETKLAASERFRRYGGALITPAGDAHERT